MSMFHESLSCLLALCVLCVAACAAREVKAAEKVSYPPIPVLNWEPRSDWVNVRDFGALGDGVADDTAAIQRAFDTVADGSSFYLPAGTYRITAPLRLGGQRRLLGVLVVGHGRETRLVWDGPVGGSMLIADGLAYSRYVGLVFDGRNRAAVGLRHPNRFFVTETCNRHLAFLNLSDAGILIDPKRVQAQAETSYENCYFENCGRGVAFLRFNDYNHTFDGCEFRGCGIGIECAHGNFYVRNTHFAGSRQVDIKAHPEHGVSVRRCTSVGSNAFLYYTPSVAPMTIQDVHVSGWKDTRGAIKVSSAPVVIFDAVFTDPPKGAAPIALLRGGQRLIMSNCKVEGARHLVRPGHGGIVYVVPHGQLDGSVRSARQRFITDNVRIPGRVFDAKRDFGAKGDGKADDTKAVQRTIDAARAHGDGAIAYLPTGIYLISDTLHITGADYYVGGSGFRTALRWVGGKGGTVVHVHDPQNVTLEHVMVATHDAGPSNNAVDILQTSSGKGSLMVYDGVRVYGMYQKQPFRKGLHLQGLGKGDVVLMRLLQGNVRVINSARATILGNLTYEGAIVVEGKDTPRDGFLGFLTRLSTHNIFGLYLKDNHSIVMSDFYFEQADNGLSFEGSPDVPEGRAVIQGAKVCQFGDEQVALSIEDYGGQIFLGPDQFYISVPRARVRHTGQRPLNLYLLGSFFYNSRLDVQKDEAMKLFLVGCDGTPVEDARYDPRRDVLPEDMSSLAQAFDELRRLGALDLKLNHPNAR